MAYLDVIQSMGLVSYIIYSIIFVVLVLVLYIDEISFAGKMKKECNEPFFSSLFYALLLDHSDIPSTEKFRKPSLDNITYCNSLLNAQKMEH